MRKEKVKRRVCYFGGLLALCLILYSCLKDESDWDSQETSNGVIKGKNKELNLDAALSWYEAHQTPVVSTRSVDTKFELLSKLHWKKGLESRKEKFEVVEVPLLNKGGAVLMDSETMEKYKETELGKIRNISRMVIIKNLETGEIINFVMHIVGTYDYLMNAKHFEENSYLYRDPHFSGSVYFYEPEGSLINGWKYEDGKIVATIKQGTEEGLQMETKVTSREYVIPVCHLEGVRVEYNDCTPFVYQDPEYGLEIGIECRKNTRWDTVEVCEDIYYDQNGNSHTWYPSSDGGTTGGGVSAGSSAIAPKSKKIFKNALMIEQEWKKLEDMLNRIMDDCLGEGLYNGLSNSLKGNTISFQFVTETDASYNPETNILKLNQNMDSNELLHEMMHAYQYQKERSLTSFSNAKMNIEIEAHYAQYLYLKESLEYDTSDWRIGIEGGDKRILSIANLKDYITNNGELRNDTSIEFLDTYLEFDVITTFKQHPNYKDYPYDSSRNSLSNFSNLKEITKNC